MSTIDEIEVALELCARRPDRMNFSALKVMIAAALEDALREGAEAMREAAQATPSGIDERGIPTVTVWQIRALPLPTSKRQAVLLTDAEALAALPDCHGSSLGKSWLLAAARAIETAAVQMDAARVTAPARREYLSDKALHSSVICQTIN